MADTPPDLHHGIDPESWAEATPVPAIERRSLTPDPDAGRYTPHALRTSGAVRALPSDAGDPSQITPPASDLPTPPDAGPSAASALPAVVGALTSAPPGGGPTGLQQLLGVAGGQAAVLVALLIWGVTWMGDKLDTSIAAALDKRDAVAKLDQERKALDEERKARAEQDAHAKIHDEEARKIDARLDRLLEGMEAQGRKLDELSAKVGELQPKRR